MGISLEESTTDHISPILERIVENVTSENKTPDSIQKDFLLILIIVSMTENEFLPVDDDCEILDLNAINATHLNKWRSQNGVYEVSFIMTGFKNTPVTLIMSPLGAVALVNVVIKEFEAETYSVCLPMSKYVVAPLATTIPMIFRDLKHFSMSFKSKVLSAVKSRILVHYGYASASLVGLPEELLLNIMIYLPVAGVLNVSRTCNRLREILRSDRLWYDMLKRDFVVSADLPFTCGEYEWRDLYINSYCAKKNRDIKNRKLTRSVQDFLAYRYPSRGGLAMCNHVCGANFEI